MTTPAQQPDKDLDTIRDFIVMASDWEIQQDMALDALHRIRYRLAPSPQPTKPHPDCDGDCLSCNADTYVSCEKRINPASHSTTPVPTSTELMQLAIHDWHNREERRNRYEKQPWVNGWITGFLTPHKPDWSKEHATTIRNATLDEMRNKYLEFMHHPCPELTDKYDHCCDSEFCGLCTLDDVLESLRTQEHP